MHHEPARTASYGTLRAANPTTNRYTQISRCITVTGGVDDDEAFYTDHLVGSVIVNSRDKGGAYESVALLRTGAAWLCRGVARRLLAEAAAPADLIRNPAHRTTASLPLPCGRQKGCRGG